MANLEQIALTEHLKFNIQRCPYDHKEFPETIRKRYNVVWKAPFDDIMDRWYCKTCKEYFTLPNKYKLSVKKINPQSKMDKWLTGGT